jgi:hypothetical protein
MAMREGESTEGTETALRIQSAVRLTILLIIITIVVLAIIIISLMGTMTTTKSIGNKSRKKDQQVIGVGKAGNVGGGEASSR